VDPVEEKKNDEGIEELRRRGPNARKCIVGEAGKFNFVADFYRLEITGDNGMQPFGNESCWTMCNGEIYNHQDLPGKSGDRSDCYAIHSLFVNLSDPVEIASALDGEFAFVHFTGDKIYFARDVVGVKPLYFRVTVRDSSVCDLRISSLIAGLRGDDHEMYEVSHVPPGYLMCFDLNTRVLEYFQFAPKCAPLGLTQIVQKIGNGSVRYEIALEMALSAAVAGRVSMHRGSVGVGFFLSGGLDSSLIAAMALQRFGRIRAFTFGFDENASDVRAARKLVNYWRTRFGEDSVEWNLVIMDPAVGVRRWLEVAKAIESTDTTTVRASVPMYLLSEWISKNTDVKVLLTGEGADELFNGYLYSLYAPGRMALRVDSERLVQELYLFDVLRSDRATAAHGLEIRPPFLDRSFMELVFSRLPEECFVKSSCGSHVMVTKPVLRRIAAKYLPEQFVYARKEAFSDAVGANWLDSLEEHAMRMFHYEGKSKAGDFPHTRRMIDGAHDEVFGNAILLDWRTGENSAKKRWLPNQQWVETQESSARALELYQNEDDEECDEDQLRSPRPTPRPVSRTINNLGEGVHEIDHDG
jgi:asparagine synthase (glutamine-hydrolysing)